MSNELNLELSSLLRKFIFGACVALLAPQVYGQEAKVLLKGRYLEFQGGFTIPEIGGLGSPTMIWSELQMDKLPGTSKWAFSHPAGYVVELLEPGPIGTGDVKTWPELAVGRSQLVYTGIDHLSTLGVFWLDAETLLTSVRRTYRAGPMDDWISKVDLDTGVVARYTVSAPYDANLQQFEVDNENFHVIQTLGSGFMRINDPVFSEAVANGNAFLMGRGGYDVLGSPRGPGLGSWNIGDTTATMLIDYPNESPLRRDRYFTFPSLDPSTNTEAAQPSLWSDPTAEGGDWVAGDIGGVAHINHPEVKGVLFTVNDARGLLDYRAQGDGGSGKYFLVADPAKFYSADSEGTNRQNHEEETLNQAYPPGGYARIGMVYDPDSLVRVANGELNPWDLDPLRFDWPQGDFEFADYEGHLTRLNVGELGGAYWDNDRQLLWVTVSWPKPAKLVAYSLVVDDARPEPKVVIPAGYGDEVPPAPPQNVNIEGQ
ncbi:hypothetical protein QVZ43_12670 [Marinobacter sp. chi1]|uniref:DUF839 domain-containing protein n=1 Tax=Marinobacter suaedae TaxID=3057675 RepID=A0ABT8W330_9GAMM|nr:hypothetical protein [Marinobacter sp. chi1]MDO3722573.1 hypothetical protein [Marinobacter sp. chi1]